MDNEDIASLLSQIADDLEINGHNPYRIRAYRRAANSIRRYPKSISKILVENSHADLTHIPYIGARIAAHIKALVTHGSIPFTYHQSRPKKLFRHELRDLPGLGPKRIKWLADNLSVYTKKDLLIALQGNRLDDQKGFSDRFKKSLLKNLMGVKPRYKYFKYRLASKMIESFLDQLFHSTRLQHWVVTGEYRREAALIGDVTLLILKDHQPDEIIDCIVKLPMVAELIEVAVRHASLILQSGLKINIKVVPSRNFISELILTTGSVAHIEALKVIAKDNNAHFDQHGFIKNNHPLTFTDEKSFYGHLGLDYIEPALREGRGEVEAAAHHRLPTLIHLQDIRGDLHVHTNETDGADDLAIMVQAAIKRGYEYIAITDHSKHLAITHGLDEKRLRQQLEMIDQLNDQLKGFKILKSIEVDILEDGRLDLPNSVLNELDLCVGSIHSHFNLTLHKQTARLIKAMDNPYFNILGHATGRILQHRRPYALDIEEILQAAQDRHCVIELNAQPSRLDIKDIYCHLAKLMGVKIAISSDAHSTSEFANMQYGVMQGRRGWLEKSDVINTFPLSQMLMMLKRHR